MSHLNKIILLFSSFVMFVAIGYFFFGSLPKYIQVSLGGSATITLVNLVMIFISAAVIVVVLAKFHKTSDNMLVFISTIIELQNWDISNIQYCFHPLLLIDFYPDIKVSDEKIFMYGLKNFWRLTENEQEKVKSKLQKVFDSCLHKLAVRFFEADKAQMAFRKKYEKMDRSIETLDTLKETMSMKEIDAIYEEKKALQKDINEVKKVFNEFRNNVRNFGFKTWPDYKAYVLLKVD